MNIVRPEGIDDGQAARLERDLRRAGRAVQMMGWCVDLVDVAVTLDEDDPRRGFVVGRLQVVRGLTEAVAG